MNKQSLFISLLITALVIAVLQQGGMVNASFLARATETPRTTRVPGKNRTATARAKRPTRDRTTNPRKTRTAEPTAEATATTEPTGVATAQATAQFAPDVAGALSSQLLILNPDRAGTARVTINVFDLDGSLAFSDTLRIKQNGAKLFTLPKSVGNDFLGSARVSANRRVQALVLDTNSDGSAGDMYEVTNVLSSTVTLPYVAHLPATAQHSLIAVQNTSSLAADATFTAYDTSGTEVLSQPLAIPPHASAYLKTGELFGTTPFVGSARLTANHLLAVAELSAYANDTVSLRAAGPAESSPNLVVPGFERKLRKDGSATSWNEMYVRNNGAAATDIKLTFFNNKGNALKQTVTRKNVPAGGLATIISSDGEFGFLGNRFIGWVRVTSTGDTPLVIHSLAARARGKQRMGVGAVLQEHTGGRQICGSLAFTPKQDSTLVLTNPRKGKAKVQVRLYDRKDGAQVAGFKVIVPPNGQIPVTAKIAFPGRPGSNPGTNFTGMAILTSNAKSARSLSAIVSTQTKQGKKVKSTSAYLCR